ncbi:hypothetical protein [Dactylosporangium sp. NPDC051541]|uniref:hypothetical protein n=1 Tax=Dactylosporangium sp. NPDC051541 TaxID=3363977 RepID=UPI0037A7FC1E
MRFSRLLVAVVLVTAGCGSPAIVGSPPASYAPDDLVLQVHTSGGLVTPATAFSELPQVSVYGDGRVIVNGPVSAGSTAPALPNARLRHVPPAEVRRWAERALEAGVGNGADLGVPQVMDAPGTRISVLASSGRLTTDVPALGLHGGLSLSQTRARQPLEDLVHSLRDLERGGTEPYEPKLMAAVAEPWPPSRDAAAIDPPAMDWPGPTPLPGEVADRLRVHCVTVDAAPLLSAAAKATRRTPWLSGDTRWQVSFRPLLPHESTCADLAL